MIRYTLRNALRTLPLQLLSALVLAVLTACLLLFGGQIDLHREELQESYRTLPVTAHLVGASASQTPRLDEERYTKIIASPFVYTHAAMLEHRLSPTLVLRAVDDPGADPALSAVVPAVCWNEGYDESVLQSDEPVCLLPAAFPDEPFLFSIGTQEFSLAHAGSYSGGLGTPGGGSIVYCPLAALRKILQDAELPVLYSGLTLELQQTELLDAFKAEMKALGMTEGSARLVIADERLERITDSLRRQILLLEMLLPVFLALTAAIGFGLSALLLRRRRREAAVLRSLGVSRTQLARSLLLETLLQAISGAACACAISGGAGQPGILLLTPLCWLFGSAAAIRRLTRVNVFTVMTEKE